MVREASVVAPGTTIGCAHGRAVLRVPSASPSRNDWRKHSPFVAEASDAELLALRNFGCLSAAEVRAVDR